MSSDSPAVGTARNAGSFRDPSGYVFEQDGRVFRAINAECFAILASLTQDGWLANKPWANAVVSTRVVPAEDPVHATLASQHPDYGNFLEHERVETITYPYEWTYSMLADAARLTLALQLALLERQLSLKDGTAYNIQFVRGRPIFIDVASIETPHRLDLWYALGQFQRMFLLPLLLCRYRGWDFRSYFVANLDGRNYEQVGRSFGWGRWRPGLILDVALPLLFERKAGRNGAAKQRQFHQSGQDPLAQKLNLQRLQRKIDALARGYSPRSDWANYARTCTYDDGAESAKKKLVAEWLGAMPARRVLDAGCNTGDYSYVAAETGAAVMAADADHDAVETLYRRLKEKPAAITPIVLDLANPSPAIGYLNEERPAFLDRVEADCVLALALIHHLLVSANLSLTAISNLFHRLTRRDLILEFVPLEDPMFQRLLQFRVNLFEGLTLAGCLEAFAPRFELMRQQSIPNSHRTLLWLRKRQP
jgi:SAM-dependent methyltransferase